jgi:cytochrome c biogenesis protein CcmG/thiol:disulfide interchange protein DsbE
MEKNENSNLGAWIDDRLRVIRPEAEWRPNTAGGLSRLRAQLDVRSVRRRRLIWAVAGIAAGVVLILSLPPTRAAAERYASACARLWSQYTGSHGTLVFTERSDRTIAPNFVLTDSSGTQVRLSDFRGKVVLLSLWDTECAPCDIEIPWFIEFQQRYEKRDLVVLSIALDKDGWSSIRPYIAEKKINHHVLAGTEDVAHLYGDSIPTALIIDRNGRVAVTHVGLCAKQEYETAIESTLNER